ncbi:hypothetical protein PULV_b0388 [Pseudoalteromonas ulvae UL12]|uniref:hypothetical protein n=1 Tax=Pseudoalteromonas ulvae TaxID=107327 RepID=UPI00186B5AFB|nr:hypothetical protein [Pseudoalteromonas ulvae]MBE0365740.1 hypothetical protein [Pseudoalteromonas ulvae UL12]
MDNLSKAEIAILSVFLGWFLGQGAEFIKSFIKQRRTLKALYLELSDMSEHLKNSKNRCAKSLCEFLDNQNGIILPQPVSTPIYDNFYKDICMKLTSEQRKTCHQIYAHAISFNNKLSELSEQVDKSDIPNKLIEAHIDAAWAHELIDHFIEHDGKSSLLENKDKVDQINDGFQVVWRQLEKL